MLLPKQSKSYVKKISHRPTGNKVRGSRYHRREDRSMGSSAGNNVPRSTNVFSASLKNCKSWASGWAPFLPCCMPPPNNEASPPAPPPPPPPPPFSKNPNACRNSFGVVATSFARWQGMTRRNGHLATRSAQSRTGSGSRLSRSTCNIGATSRPPCVKRGQALGVGREMTGGWVGGI